MHPGEGDELRAFGHPLTVLLNGEQTGGKIAVLRGEVPPGGGPPLHVHHRDDEIFLVTEGRIRFFVDGTWTEVAAGGTVYLPKGIPHRFHNNSTVVGHYFVITTPSGFEKLFAECAVEFAKPGGPDRARIIEIHDKYGNELLDEK